MNEQNNNLIGTNSSNLNNSPALNSNLVEPPSVIENINVIQPDAVPNINQAPVETIPQNVEIVPPASQTIQVQNVNSTPVVEALTAINSQPIIEPEPIQPGQNSIQQPMQEVQTPVQQPIQSTQIVQTAQTTQSMEPVQSVQPIQPVQPVQTIQSVQPVQNVQQVQTEQVINEIGTTNQSVYEQPVNINPQTINNEEPLNNDGQNGNITPTTTPTPVNNPVSSGGTFGPSKPMSNDANITNIGFIESNEPLPKKKSKTPLFIILIVLIGLGAIGYFVVYPYVLKTFFNDPMNVYSTTIDGVFKEVNTSINEIVHNKAIYDIQLSLDSNIEVLKPYSGHKYALNYGINPQNQNLQLGYSITTPNNLEYSAYSYVKDNKKYERFSTYRDVNGKIGLIYTGEVNNNEISDIFSSFQFLLDNTNKVSNEDLTYLTDKLSKALISSIDENKLSKEDASITINGNKLKVTNNKYIMDLDNKRRTLKYIVDEFKNDEKTLEIIANITGITKDEVKTKLDINVDEKITNDDILYINIYTYGNKNSIVGFALNDEKEEIDFHYYSKDKNYFEAYLYFVTDNDETGKREESKINVIGINNADGNKITFSKDDKDLLILDVKKLEENDIEFDYTLKDDDGDFTGTIKFSKDINNDRLKISFAFSTKVAKDENLSINLEFTEDWASDISNINTSANGSVVTLSEEELNNVRNNFSSELYNSTPVGVLFQTVSGMYTPDINEYYNNENGNLEAPLDSENEVTDNYTDTGTDININQNGTEVNGY